MEQLQERNCSMVNIHKEEAKKKESESEEDDDMGSGLFD